MSGQTPKKIQEYVTFPLSLYQGLLLADLPEIKSIIKRIIGYGRADFAINKKKYETGTLARQAFYLFYAEHLPVAFMFEAKQAISKGNLRLYSEEKKGFAENGTEFIPDHVEVDELFKFINKNNYPEVWDWCKLSFDVPHDQIGEYYKVYLECVQVQKEFTKKHGNDATVSVKYYMLADFYKNPPATELLAAYFAIRSLQGKNTTYIKTFKKTILLRMTGSKSYLVLDDIYSIELSEKMERLGSKRRFLSLLSKLEDRGLLTGRFVIPNKKVNFFLLSTSIDTVEIARLYATGENESDRAKKQKEALELYNRLIAEKK